MSNLKFTSTDVRAGPVDDVPGHRDGLEHVRGRPLQDREPPPLQLQHEPARPQRRRVGQPRHQAAATAATAATAAATAVAAATAATEAHQQQQVSRSAGA